MKALFHASRRAKAIPRSLGAAMVVAVIVSMTVGVAGSGTASAQPYSIPSPISGGWQLNGTSLLNTGASPPNLQLTPATNDEAGSAFYPLAVPGVGIERGLRRLYRLRHRRRRAHLDAGERE